MLLLIEKTENTPLVVLTNNSLQIEGEIRPEYARNFFQPLFDKMSDLKSESFNVNCAISFVSSSSILQLKRLFNVLKDNSDVKSTLIDWNYERTDDELLEIGQYLAELSQLDFKFSPIEFQSN